MYLMKHCDSILPVMLLVTSLFIFYLHQNSFHALWPSDIYGIKILVNIGSFHDLLIKLQIITWINDN